MTDLCAAPRKQAGCVTWKLSGSRLRQTCWTRHCQVIARHVGSTELVDREEFKQPPPALTFEVITRNDAANAGGDQPIILPREQDINTFDADRKPHAHARVMNLMQENVLCLWSLDLDTEVKTLESEPKDNVLQLDTSDIEHITWCYHTTDNGHRVIFSGTVSRPCQLTLPEMVKQRLGISKEAQGFGFLYPGELHTAST